MTLISNNLYNLLFFTFCNFAFFFVLFFPTPTHAQESLALSVTPTLFEMSALEGQLWRSSVKVINSNSFPITVYAEVVNFAPQGEAGHGKLIPVFEKVTEGSTLAEWITVEVDGPVTIAPEQSKIISFTTEVPDDAAPGGHFAAILVGTRPPNDGNNMVIKTSQVVTSLFFVRIEGDVKELGTIRSFATVDMFSQIPEADFELRFENKGNVHLQPKGNIIIYNMWGKERGNIPINIATHFGNVLPDSIRNFKFSWTGEQSIADIGRYKAVAGLAYGAENKKFETRTAHFWVVPLKSVAITVIVTLILIYFVTWAIRAYARRMLSLAGLNPNETNLAVNDKERRPKIVYEGDVALKSKPSLTEPLRFGIQDLQLRLKDVRAGTEFLKVLLVFMFTYKIFFAVLFGLFIVAVGLVMYFGEVTTDSRDFEVSIQNADTELNLNSEEIALQEILSDQHIPLVEVPEQAFEINIVNTSGVPQTAASVAAQLIIKEYEIGILTSDASRKNTKSAIVFDVALQDDALEISDILGGALLSARPDTASTAGESITIFVGEDQVLQ